MSMNPIPPLNDFLVPFLQILGDGQPHTRAQMLLALAKRLNVSEEEAQQKSGNQFTLVNRLAWCDTHLVRAGFVEKRQDRADSMQDSFSIAPLGMRELSRDPARITVGYLQSFYRGKIYRGAGSDDTTSEAELTLYEQLEALPGEFTVLHAVKWFGRDVGSVGEIDFLIAHPSYGVLVLEVKGGEISMERRGNNSLWYSRDRNGALHEIHDPCNQAERNRRALGDWLERDPRTRGLRFALFPAVALPDSRVGGDIRPDCTEAIFIDIRHLDNLKARLLEIFAYWKDRADARNREMSGQHAVKALVDLLVPSRQLGPRVADIFERERQKIDELTQQQYAALRLLRRHRRAAIVGGAGTGKTMLAMEKAHQLAQEGYRVLFLCFNKNLASWLGSVLKDDNIVSGTFHSLVGHAIHWANLRGVPRDPQEFMDRAAEMLEEAIQVIRAPGSGQEDKLFDAIIVDEAQDFEDTWWIVLPDLLRDPEAGVFYVFFDDNQRLHTQLTNIPLEGEPFYLEENCRNTQHIHAALTPYTRVTTYETLCHGPQGRPVEFLPTADAQEARRQLQRVFHRLVRQEGIRPEDIVMLTPASEKRSMWPKEEQIGPFILTWDMETEMEDAIRVCTVYRYKGLESAVVILTELDQGREEVRDQLMYVALSRARHHVVVIGALPAPVSEEQTEVE